MKPTVTVVIPFFNNLNWLEQALHSIFEQTYAAHEIIIVNDGSNENMIKFLEKYSEKIIYIYKMNEGPAVARNLGIEMSTGDYIAFLDSDDIWLPEKLEKQINLMEKNQSIWSHTSYEKFVDGSCNNQKRGLINVSAYNGCIFPKLLASSPIATPCVIVKGEVLRNNRKLRFNNSMRYGQDSYLWVKLAIEYDILAIDEVLTRVRMRGSNAALRATVQLKVRRYIWECLKEFKGDFKGKEIPLLAKISFLLSVIGSKILEKLELIIKKETLLENISRILYFIPWSLFKIVARR